MILEALHYGLSQIVISTIKAQFVKNIIEVLYVIFSFSLLNTVLSYTNIVPLTKLYRYGVRNATDFQKKVL